MWNIDLSYREEFQTTFERLYEKLAVLNQHRPLPHSAISKIKEALTIEWTYILIVLKEILFHYEKHK